MKKWLLGLCLLAPALAAPAAPPAVDVPALQARAEQGDAKASYELGLHFLRKLEGAPAEKYFLQAAAAGSEAARLELLYGYISGRVLPLKPAEGLALLTVLEQSSENETLASLAWLYYCGYPGALEPNYEKALVFAEKAKDKGYGQLVLGYLYGRGLAGLQTDEPRARESFLKAVSLKPTGESCMAAARCLRYGIGGSPDGAKAVRLYRRAAEVGFTGAMVALAEMYWSGEGVTADVGESLHWARQAAEKGSSQGHYLLGLCLLKGSPGTPADPAAARRCFERSGLDEAKCALATLLQKGVGGPADAEQAHLLLLEAADGGYVPAYFPLGVSFMSKSPAAAFEWIEKAAEAGNLDAQLMVARLYEKGIKGQPDPVTAERWYEKAAAQDAEKTRKARAGSL